MNSGAGNFYAIDAAGAPGNRSAVGARLTFEHADGTREVRDITAGGGYLTQQPARLHHASPSSNPLKKITITWPDGVRSHAVIPPTPAPITLRR